MHYVESLLELVGNTPLLRLSKLTDGAPGLVLAKIEYLNPGGSIKDRIALRMIEAAERDGSLQPGGTIVEPTSGNTGVGLAMVAQAKGYACIFVCPDKVSEEKRNVLKAYGAEVVVCPTSVEPSHPDSYYSVSDRLARETVGGWKPDQYSNPENPASHYATTGPEIWEQTDGRVTHFVTGMGTGGTVSGAGRFLKEKSNGRVQVVGVDPEGSIYSGGSGRPYLVEGVGEDFWPAAYDPRVPDQILTVSDKESFLATRRLAREEALLIGGSSGMAAAAAVQLAHELDDPAAVIVVLLPDGGRGYLAKVFDDAWLASYGFLRSSDAPTVGDVLRARGARASALAHLRPEATISQAIAALRAESASWLPVVRAEPPVLAAEVAGLITEQNLLDALNQGRAQLGEEIGRHLSPPPRWVGAGEPVSSGVTAVRDAGMALVLDEGKVAGALTSQDLLSFLAGG